jgi:hypothetical protein
MRTREIIHQNIQQRAASIYSLLEFAVAGIGNKFTTARSAKMLNKKVCTEQDKLRDCMHNCTSLSMILIMY